MGNFLKRRGKVIAEGVVLLLALAQVVRPARTNPPTAAAQTLEAGLSVPPAAGSILQRSCGDCHSNQTRWPWYSNLAPVSWLVVRDVDGGRHHMNFSAWPRSKPASAAKLLDHICKEVTTGDMPLWFYLPLHPSARLSHADVQTLCQWTAAARQRLGLPPAQASR